MRHLEQYKVWLESNFADESIKEELRLIEDCPEEIEDRFYKDLEFGTAGLRGVIGAGTNRINVLTVSRATQGLADYLNELYDSDISVAIAYDSRHMSKEFAQKSAEVLAANGIKTYIFEELRSTPELSFAVRELKCDAGIVITASHNPSQYNGYKVYNSYGGQILENEAELITEAISKIEFDCIKCTNNLSDKNIIHISKEIDDKYINSVKSLRVNTDVDYGINIVYTPLHGTGNMPVRRVLKEIGFRNVYTVSEQEIPDPNFATVKLPNPEDIEAFDLAIKIAKKVKADIVLGTDPDCDRVGVVVRDEQKNEYVALNGNQVGALLINYILQSKKEKNILSNNLVMINTIVTSDLGEKIAKKYGVKTIKTLTGFKYIADKIKNCEKNNQEDFVFGYEESYGYLYGDFARDKDAVTASMLIAEMSAFYKKRGSSLLNVLKQLYSEYNYYIDETVSVSLEGISGQNKIIKIIEYFRDNKPTVICGKNISSLYDYKLGIFYDFITGDFEKLDFPKSNVLKFIFEDGSWFVIRPSGTEPKMKIYFSFCGEIEQETKDTLENVKTDFFAIMNCIV